MRSLPEQERRRRRNLRSVNWSKHNAAKRTKSVRNHNWKSQGILNSQGELFTYADYDAIFARQEGRCRVCLAHSDDLKKGLVVDHNHATNKVRGLLCDRCNVALGGFKDSSHLLKAAFTYVEGALF